MTLKFVKKLLHAGAPAVAVVSLWFATAAAPDAHAASQAFTCQLNASSACTIGVAFYHINRVNVWYEGAGEIVIGAGLNEYNRGQWGEVRNRSNNSSVVTLDSGCQTCSFQAQAFNWSGGFHTIQGRFYYN